jgi:hypothetical protein
MPRPPKLVSKVRLNLDVPIETKEMMLELQAKLNADSITEVIRRSIMLCHFAVKGQIEGASVILKHGKKTKEIIIV